MRSPGRPEVIGALATTFPSCTSQARFAESDTHAPSPEIEHGIGWAEDDDGRLVPAVRAREVAVAFVAAGRVGVVTGSVVTPAVTGDTASGAAATGAAAVATAAGDAVPTSASPSPVLTPMAPSTTTADPAIPTLVIRIAFPRPRSNRCAVEIARLGHPC
ncbi:hypothetical protein Acsp07_00380 [Actinomycetospora sp. NBRC 106378]|nr:hypothetical protein Acsp07_00380 [Actinomycetospora sp. NBRC 106378]